MRNNIRNEDWSNATTAVYIKYINTSWSITFIYVDNKNFFL